MTSAKSALAPRAAPTDARPRGAWRQIGVVPAVSGMAAVLIALLLAFGPLAWSQDPNQTDLRGRLAGPSRAHPFGTDEFGRDLLARVLHGGRRSLGGAAAVVAGATGLGMVAGVAAASRGRTLDAFLARAIDALLAVPPLVIALAIVGILGKSFGNLLLALVLTGWPWYARVYRSFVLRERNAEYVTAAIALGCAPTRIVWRHIGPNVIGPALVLSSVNLGNAVLGLASLSFLGLGVQPPHAEWGAMVSEARGRFDSYPWLMVVPGLAIGVTVVIANLLGDAIRDAVDPRGPLG